MGLFGKSKKEEELELKRLVEKTKDWLSIADTDRLIQNSLIKIKDFLEMERIYGKDGWWQEDEDKYAEHLKQEPMLTSTGHQLSSKSMSKNTPEDRKETKKKKIKKEIFLAPNMSLADYRKKVFTKELTPEQWRSTGHAMCMRVLIKEIAELLESSHYHPARGTFRT